MPADPRAAVYRQIDRDLALHIETVLAMIRQPSISATGEGIAGMASSLCERLRALGADVEPVPTPRHPIVYGRLDSGAPRTVLFYELYDVQPAPPEGWLVPPFQPAVVDLPGHGPSIVGRGAFNSKGPLCAFINVLEAMRRAGVPCPVNVVFLIEGEEEVGSTSLPGFIRDQALSLRACDAVFQPYFGQNAAGQPIVYLGCKGMMYLELTCRGDTWGGPTKREIHALHSAWISNPAWRLVQALATLKEPGPLERTAIPGWYDDVRPPTPWELERLDELAGQFLPAVPLQEQGALRYKLPEGATQREFLAAYLWEPTLNLDGVWAGYTGSGSKTVIPHLATAKLDIRPVPNMDLERLLRLLRVHLDAGGYQDIEVRVLTQVPWSQSDPDSGAVRSLLAALREHCEVPPQIWPRSGGMVPHHLFTRELGLPVAFGGLGHGGRAHSTNEYITVEGLRLHEKSVAAFLYAFADHQEGA